MAQLIYKTQNGSEHSVSLSSEASSTVRVVSIFAMSSQIESELWQQLKQEMVQLKARELVREAVHALYEVNEYSSKQLYQLFCIIQLRESASRDKSDSHPWIRDAVLLHRSNREWIVVAEGNTHFLIDQKPVPVVKVLQHGMKIRLGDLDLKFTDIERITVDKSVLGKLGAERKCPFCQGVFRVGDVLVLCPSCRTAHHVECWEDYGNRCSGPTGCRYGLPMAPIPA